jgi:hypothetical protein
MRMNGENGVVWKDFPSLFILHMSGDVQVFRVILSASGAARLAGRPESPPFSRNGNRSGFRFRLNPYIAAE